MDCGEFISNVGGIDVTGFIGSEKSSSVPSETRAISLTFPRLTSLIRRMIPGVKVIASDLIPVEGSSNA